MQLRPDQLASHLEQALAPVYVVSGDEPLQVEECADQIRAAARERAFTDRNVLFAESGFDWAELQHSGDTFSLFSERRLIELRLPTGKPGDAGSKAIAAYLARASDDNLLLVIAPQLDARTRRTKWYQALERAGVAIQAWPIDPARLPRWIQARARSRGWSISADAAGELALRVEGNLLACAQDIELLGLLNGARPIDLDAVLAVAADQARFDTFDLVDATLDGDVARSVRILRGLRAEGVVPTAITGTVAWESRAMAGFAAAERAGQLAEALRGNPVWNRRRALVGRALKRHRPEFWQDALVGLGAVDAMTKGAAPGDPWEALSGVCLGIAGLVLPSSRRL